MRLILILLYVAYCEKHYGNKHSIKSDGKQYGEVQRDPSPHSYNPLLPLTLWKDDLWLCAQISGTVTLNSLYKMVVPSNQ
jgi:hypothetical protein